MFRFLPGIIILQTATVVLVYAALKTPIQEYWVTFGVIGLITGVLAALWFGSIAKRVKKEAVARTKEDLAREREKLRVSVEQEKTKIIEQTHKKIVKETNRAHARANLKVGAALVGTLGLGGVMILTQFVTLGLITMTLSGGVLGGYVWRARRDRIARRIADQGRMEAAAPAGVMDLRDKPPALPFLRRESS
ncbi:MAG: hypothetical protein ACREVH_04990 [Gammaproteobacteria bacterium]